MKALIMTGHGSADVLEVGQVERPSMLGAELLIRVMASGLNRADILQRRGFYPAPPGVPDNILGLEYAGIVEEVGSDVTLYQPGDRVMGLVGGGACAEFVVTHEELALPIPPNLEYLQAAALPEAFMTAYDAMVLQGGLAKNGSVAITAATSGVGTAAVQLAGAYQATIFASTRSREKLSSLTLYGATYPVCGGSDELLEAIRSETEDGVDVVLDLVGGSGVDTLIGGLRSRGTLVLVGLLGGAKTNLNLARLLGKRATLKGTVLRSRSHAEKRSLTESVRANLLPLFTAGELKPVIQSVFPLANARDAHIALEANQHVGKILLDHT